MNILSTMPGLDPAPETDLTPEEIEAQEKAERIAFHRDKVANGPVKFTFMTSGQVRRAKKRDENRAARKRWRSQKRNYFANLRAAAILRAHLQNLGLIPFVDGHEASRHDQIVSTAWINVRYGTEGSIPGHASFERPAVLAALAGAAKFYETVTGHAVEVPSDYEPALYSVMSDEVSG